MLDLGKICDCALKALTEVGDFVTDSQDKIQSIKYKGVRDPQTDVDVKSEQMLVDRLKSLLPGAGFMNEESGDSVGSEYNWTVDSIDGTKFFTTGFPVYFSQISLVDSNNDPLFAAIYTPVSRQMFYAIKGSGTYLNGVKIALKDPGPLSESIINIEIGKLDNDEESIDLLRKLGTNANRIFVISGLLAPYIITNTVQAYVRYNNGVNHPYDILPRWLIIKEAAVWCPSTCSGDGSYSLQAASKLSAR